jgi:hypothetical protein
MAAWRSGDEVMVTKIRPSGWFANPLRMAVPNHSFSMNPSLAHAGSGRAVVVCQATPDPPPWDDPTFGVFAALVRSDLTVGGAIVELGGTRPAGETRTDPRIASGWRPGECLVVWSGPTIMGQHLSVTPTGSVALVGAPFRLVPSSPYGRHPWGPTVAWDPLSQYYHVVWAAMGDDWEWLILGTRVRARQPRPHPWHRETAWVRSVGDEVYTPALDFATRRLGGYRSAGALSWERQKHAAETDQDVYGSPLPTTGGRVAWNDYTGDSASDLAVYNTLSGKWYVKSLRPGGVSWNGRVWGNAGTTPVTGDYAGYDSWQCTRAVYERDTGKWYFSSTSGDWSSSWVWWGGRGMDPVPGVYGRHPYWDLAVYERDTGDWFILDSRFPGVPILYRANWGGPGTVPVPGDYDGDDVWDLAVYAGNTGRWYIRSLNPSLPAICMGKNWGGPGMVPVPGDYDGDGIWDLAMYHKGTGNWYIRRVDDGVPLICFGLNWGGALGDPVPGDYNGDGIYDLAVYERATGKWYILNRVSRVPIVFGLPWGSSSMDPVGVCR